MIKLDDVAKKAGVSKSTASMALNNSSKIKQQTKDKVKKAAQQLDYIPHAMGKALASNSTMTIGLVIPEVNNQFFSEIVQLTKNQLKKYNYNLILCTTEYSYQEEKKHVDLFKSGQVDGAIFVCPSDQDNRYIIDFARNYKPVVFVNRGVEPEGEHIIPVIKSDLVGASYQATRHLIDLGHTSIGFVGNPYEERYKGYCRAMDEYGLDHAKYLVDLQEKNLNSVLENKNDLPTAFVCYNDHHAFKLILLLKNIGIEVPDDISICGIDNLDFSAIYNPPLTTVNQQKDRIIKKSVQILMKMINQEKISEEDYHREYPTDLVIRKSTAAFKG